ncbi:Tyrosinase [Scedosporium apiospermum]|uniref:tyrosinase n=1 Tax=Pseudallescheria apiosperma TaxID=563466 RepID=A0A084GGH5_PSEDA|nr:Tyrosinase [Scedosporium apiospermum]KEZ46437.1 Tyrosinase [Scedosporium apiospermum]
MSSQGNIRVVGSLPLRREIRDLEANFPEQFSLFILAFKALQAKDKTDPTSYYQIAGIHGMPYKVWNNARGLSNFDFGGYCTHSSILFLTWHRPYLALFEQALYAAAQGIAARYPENVRSRYVEAAKQLRLPFFDWAARVREPAPSFPDSIAKSRIAIVDIDGRRKTIENPLYSFNIGQVQPDRGDLTGRWATRLQTLRHPDSRNNSHNEVIEQELDNESASLRQELSLLLLSFTDYDDFSNSTWRQGSRVRATTSLESVHDDIHGRTGGSGGHMGALDVSAMDPVFWLHHSNVDRIWAMWQDLNQDEFMSPRPAPFSNFTVRRGSTEDAQSPLTPFWDETGTKFWTSDRVKSTTTFGYAYPETQRWQYASVEAYQRALRQTIARLYGSNPFLNFAQTIAPKDAAAERPTFESLAALPTTMLPVRSLAAGVKLAAAREPPQEQKVVEDDTKENPAANPEPSGESLKPPENPIQEGDLSAPIPDSMKRLCPEGRYTDWVVNVRTLKHGLGQTFRVIVFLGDFSPSPADWAGNAEYNTVGRVTMLGRNSDTQCGKCQEDQENDLMIAGAVPLTSALLQDIAAGKLQSLEPKDVVPHLKKDLHWRVKLFDGTEYAVDQVPRLKVSVCSMPVTLGEDGVPVYSGVYTIHKEATAGKAAGLGEDEEW